VSVKLLESWEARMIEGLKISSFPASWLSSFKPPSRELVGLPLNG
jgi:hypothetical protein